VTASCASAAAASQTSPSAQSTSRRAPRAQRFHGLERGASHQTFKPEIRPASLPSKLKRAQSFRGDAMRSRRPRRKPKRRQPLRKMSPQKLRRIISAAGAQGQAPFASLAELISTLSYETYALRLGPISRDSIGLSSEIYDSSRDRSNSEIGIMRVMGSTGDA
jgi:hypothetical protein